MNRILAQNSTSIVADRALNQTQDTVSSKLSVSENSALAKPDFNAASAKPVHEANPAAALTEQNQSGEKFTTHERKKEGSESVKEKVKPIDPYFISEVKNSATFGVFYKVKIGAYLHPNNFKYPQLKSLGTAETLLLNDGITRFTMAILIHLMRPKLFRKRVLKRELKMTG